MTIKTGQNAAANDFIGNPADFLAIFSSTSGTLDVTVDGYQRLLVLVKGNLADVGNETVTVSVRQDTVVKDTVIINANSGGDRVPFALMYVETPAADTYTIDVTEDDASHGYENLVITVIRLRTGYAP